MQLQTDEAAEEGRMAGSVSITVTAEKIEERQDSKSPEADDGEKIIADKEPEPQEESKGAEPKDGIVADQIGLVHQGILAIDLESSEEKRFFRLYHDRLEHHASEEEAKAAPEKGTIISKSDVNDLEVMDSGFKVKHKEGRVVMKTAGQDDLDVWLQHLGVVFGGEVEGADADVWEAPAIGASALLQAAGGQAGTGDEQLLRGYLLQRQQQIEEPSPSPICQSMLSITEGLAKDKWYFVLYHDRLECYGRLSDMVHGLEARGCVPLKSIRDVEVEARGFIVHLLDYRIELGVDDEELFDAWVAAWHRVLDYHLPHAQPLPSRTSKDGIKLLHKGPLQVRRRQKGPTESRTFYLFEDRLEWFRDASEETKGRKAASLRVSDVKGFDVIESGFALHTEATRLEFKVAEKRELATWLSAWETAKRRSRERESKDGLNMLPIGPFRDISLLGAPHVIRHGLLGIQEAGRLVKKYFVVYKGRMEYYNSAEDAKSASVVPSGTFWLEELCKLDHIGCGLVMNFEGRYVGLHAESEAGGLAWARAIRTASLFGAAAEQEDKSDMHAELSAIPSVSMGTMSGTGGLPLPNSNLGNSIGGIVTKITEPVLGTKGKGRTGEEKLEEGQGQGALDESLAQGQQPKGTADPRPSSRQTQPDFDPCYPRPATRDGGYAWGSRQVTEKIVAHEENVWHRPVPSAVHGVASSIGSEHAGILKNLTARRESVGSAKKWHKISSKGNDAPTGSFRLHPRQDVVQASPRETTPWKEPPKALSEKVTESAMLFGHQWQKTSPLDIRGKTKPWEAPRKVQSWEANTVATSPEQRARIAAQRPAGTPSGNHI